MHPAIASVALFTGLIPVVIHLINRRRYRRVTWAAMSFLLAANRQSSRRMRLEQWLLMLARISLIVLLGLAVARPYTPASAVLPASLSRIHRILVVDNSLSMNASAPGDRSRFAAAQECAAKLVQSFPLTDAVSLVTMSATAEAVLAQPAYDRRWIRESVSALQSTQRPTDAPGAVDAVLQILKESPAASGNRVVYVISDFTRRDWESPSPQNPTSAARAVQQLYDSLTDAATNLVLIRIDNRAEDNLAVTRLTPESSLIGLNMPARILVEVTNFGSSTVRNSSLQVRRDGLIVRREMLPPLAPGKTVVSTMTTEFPVAGTHSLEARIAPEAPGQASFSNVLSLDDARYLSVEAVEERPVLLVDGRPGLRLLDGQAGFLATALAPQTTTGSAEPRGVNAANLFAPRVVDDSQLAHEILSDYDAVALCNVERLTSPQWTGLQEFVAQGGGVLFVLGERVSREWYNRNNLPLQTYGRLLPGTVGSPGTVAEGVEVGFKPAVPPHAIVADLAEYAGSGLHRAGVRGFVSFEPDPQHAEVVMRYTNEAPALVASSFGSGRVLVWTTTVNMDWTNLPAKGDFVGLVHNAFAFLLPQRGAHRNLRVGQILREPLSAVESASTLRVMEDDGAAHEPTIGPAGLMSDGLALEYGPVERSQFLTLSIGTQTRSVAVNVDPAESDLAPLGAPQLPAAVGRPVRVASDREISEGESAGVRSTELASFAAYAVLGLLLCELWMAMRFGRPTGPTEEQEERA